jgi:hypothetical protein
MDDEQLTKLLTGVRRFYDEHLLMTFYIAEAAIRDAVARERWHGDRADCPCLAGGECEFKSHLPAIPGTTEDSCV